MNPGTPLSIAGPPEIQSYSKTVFISFKIKRTELTFRIDLLSRCTLTVTALSNPTCNDPSDLYFETALAQDIVRTILSC